jgi:lipoprotein-releasing system permease protein
LKSILFIALRFFLESRRSMILSSLGVVFGVAFFITGQAQTQGFQSYFIETILGSKGAVVVDDRFQNSYTQILQGKHDGDIMVSNPQTKKYYPGIDEAYRVIETLMKFPNVVACSPIVQGNASIRSGFRSDVAVIQGIDLDYHLKTTDLAKQIVKGNLEDFRSNPDAIAIGTDLADKLELNLGQNVYLMGPDGDNRRFKFTTIYETGINAIDQRRVYVHRRAAQAVLQMPYSTSQIVLKLKNPTRAPEDAQTIEDLLSHRARPWQESEKSNLQIFSTLRLSAGLGISCIILLAGFGIFNILMMSVLEKTKEISILRSMGYTRGDVASIFICQGLGIASVGILFGFALGAFMTFAISNIPIKIRGIFKADKFIVEWSWDHYLLAAFLALVAVLIAAYIPARKAASVEPVNILRGTSN